MAKILGSVSSCIKSIQFNIWLVVITASLGILSISAYAQNAPKPFGDDPDFGSVATGSTVTQSIPFGLSCPYATDCQGFTVTNVSISGDSSFSVVDLGTCNGFSVPSTPAGGGAGCSVTVGFSPSSAGFHQANVVFTWVDTASAGSSFPIGVTGTGIAGGTSDAQQIDSTSSCNINANSSINVDNRSLNETIPVVGSPFVLAYQSDRVIERRDIGLGGWTVSAHHFYDVAAKKLYFGSGGFRSVTATQYRGSLLIPALDGSEAYLFDQTGRHQATVQGLTGATLYSFKYDASGRIASVTDAFGGRSLFLVEI